MRQRHPPIAAGSALFLMSALLSFLSIRSGRLTLRFERWAKILFLVALAFELL